MKQATSESHDADRISPTKNVTTNNRGETGIFN